MKAGRRRILVILASALVAQPSVALVMQFEDRTAWNAAAGPASVTEDFEGFVGTTSFSNTTVALNGMTIRAIGPRVPQTIRLDAGDVDNVNGSVQVFGKTESGPTNLTTVSVVFDDPVSAWGADFVGHDGAENLIIDLLDSKFAVLFSLDSSTNLPAFLGFVADGGEQIASLRFRSGNQVSGNEESFGMDNLAAVSVPEPSLLPLVGIGFAASGFLSRRRIEHS